MGEGGYKQINKALNISAFEGYIDGQVRRLAPLLDVEQLTPRVLRVLGQNPGKFTLQGTNTYIIGNGRQRVIIDTAQGYREWADLIQVTLNEEEVDLNTVLLTHWHGDHTKGVPDLIRMYPHLSDSIYKNSPERGQLDIVDGQVFRVEGATIRAVHSPGHSHDHMCFILEEENALFTGDNVLGLGTSAIEDLGLWMKSLRLMASHGCGIGYPAHGEVIRDLPGKIADELAQKIRREKQTLLALRSDKVHPLGKPPSMTVEELVLKMHGNGLPEELRTNTLEPLVAEILRKLTDDGKVAFQIKGGVRRWFAVVTN